MNLSAMLELTNNCPDACNFCFSASYDSCTRKPRVLSMLDGNAWKRGIDSLIALGIDEIGITGGEPTLHPEFSGILYYAKKRGLCTTVYSTGLIPDDCKPAIRYACDYLALSIHGVGMTHDLIKGHFGAYNRVMGIYRIFSGHVPIKIFTVACTSNIEGLTSIGHAIDIEHSTDKWKISQPVLRESAYRNRDTVAISDDAFDAAKDRLCEEFPNAYAQGRMVFRYDNSADAYAPYIIADSSGKLLIPVGNGHRSLGLTIEQDLSDIEIKTLTALTHDYIPTS